jgi:formylglycine-generating enzyme required for sulfatase activity
MMHTDYWTRINAEKRGEKPFYSASVRAHPRPSAVILVLTLILITSCAPVNLDAPAPAYDTGVDPNSWATIPAGPFLQGQAAEPASIEYDYEMMVTDVTLGQYVAFLNETLAGGILKVDGDQITGPYPGDEFHGVKHEIRIDAGDYLIVPTDDPASRFTFDGTSFMVKSTWENHPMTNVSWFGAWTYCGYYSWRLPTELEWEKAGRGSGDDRSFPWGDDIARNNANFYASRDLFENMYTFGSRTTPVGFYNGKTYGAYTTLNSASPYGLYDMAGNVWQWTGDVYAGMHYRFMRGGSKDTYDMDLRIWVRNDATPTYTSPGVGFRCARNP